MNRTLYAKSLLSRSVPARSIPARSVLASVLILFTGTLCGCDSYWWTRGQPPSSEELVQRSAAAFDEAAKIANRDDIMATAAGLKDSLVRAYDFSKINDPMALRTTIDRALDQMLELEQRVTVTSRPAMAELGGQLRTFERKLSTGELIESPTFGTFTSRVMFLLANELTVPASSPVNLPK